MHFITKQFLFFISFVLILYFSIPSKNLKKYGLLLANYFFYAFNGWLPVILLILITLITYFSVEFSHREISPHLRKKIKIISLFFIIFILFIFKIPHSVFTTKSNSIFSFFLLPVGLSFYSFQALSYIIDQTESSSNHHNFLDCAVYLSFFPSILSGPIERPNKMISQLKQAHTFNKNQFLIGLEIILLGLFKKIVIADQLNYLIHPYLDNYQGASFLQAWSLMLAYALQVYFDFSGYTLMARGIALLFGFHLSNNYQAPYLVTDISQYWQRRHMTLSKWFRDYIYIPLGGNRRGTLRQILNIFIVMTLSGLWHGLTLNYLIWGIFHACGLSFHKIFYHYKNKWTLLNLLRTNKYSRYFFLIFHHLLTFALVTAFFSFFATPHFSTGFRIFCDLFYNPHFGSLIYAGHIVGLLAILYMLDLPVLINRDEYFAPQLYPPVRWSFNLFMFLSCIAILSFDSTPKKFIYFDF